MVDCSKVVYSVPVPYAVRDEVIEVYGDPEMGWYEWRVVWRGRVIGTLRVMDSVLHDTRDTGYGCAEIALRDALVHVTRDL